MMETEPSTDLKDDAPRPREKQIRHSRRATKLEKLECWLEVLAMLDNGDRVEDIARFIQYDRREYNDVSALSLQRVIHYWIRTRRHMVPNRCPSSHVELISSTPSVDPLDALNMLFAIQMDRVSMIYNAEKSANAFTKQGNDSIRLALDIGKAMSEVDSTKKRYTPPTAGSNAPILNQLDQLRLRYVQKYGSSAAKVLLSDESRRKVLNAIEHLRKGESLKLNEILARNADKARELDEQERQRARDEAENTVDVEKIDAKEP